MEFLSQRGQANLLVEFETELDAQTLIRGSSESESAEELTLRDLARWFPAFLKIKSCPTYWLELAEFEYLQFAARNLDFGHPKLFQGRPVLHPSAQFVELRHDHSELNRGRGLYCFVKKGTRFFELQLSLRQALVLDLVQQGLVVSVEHLMEMADESISRIEPNVHISSTQWLEIIDQLVEIGILVTEDSISALGL